MAAGKLNSRLRFYKRGEVANTTGTTRGPLALQFEVWADMRLRSGSETFAASRLEGRVPYSVKVRRSSQTEAITTGWVARDARGVEYDVQAPALDPHDRGYVHMMLISGKVVG